MAKWMMTSLKRKYHFQKVLAVEMDTNLQQSARQTEINRKISFAAQTEFQLFVCLCAAILQ